MANKNNQIMLQASDQVTGDYSPALKSLASASGFLFSFPKLAFHMMITFYLFLIIFAIAAGPNGASPSLMQFVMVWHFLAFPTWLLRSLTLRLCKNPLGMLAFFLGVLLVILRFHSCLSVAMSNILTWAKAAIMAL
jgi:hypothetical protein